MEKKENMWHIIIGGQPKKKWWKIGREKKNGIDDLYSLLVKYIYVALLFDLCGESNKFGDTKRCGKRS